MKLSTVKNFSGEIRRDFYAIIKSVASEEKIFLIAKHTEYKLSDEELTIAIDELNNLNSNNYNVYTIAIIFSSNPKLKNFAQAINDGFAFKDKYTKNWRLIYALIGYPAKGSAFAEIGVTEKNMEHVIARLKSPASVKANTKIGRFLAIVEATKTECYLWQLESQFGDLDDAADIKDWWKLAGLSTDVTFPCRAYTASFTDSKKYYWRHWPAMESVIQFGFRVC